MKKRLLMLALHLAASGADAYYTQRNQSLPHHYESNPLARPFVSHGMPLLIGAFGIETAGEIAVPLWLRRHNHDHAASAIDAIAIAGHAFGAASSAAHYNPGGTNAAK